jgi:hypothetical protein
LHQAPAHDILRRASITPAGFVIGARGCNNWLYDGVMQSLFADSTCSGREIDRLYGLLSDVYRIVAGFRWTRHIEQALQVRNGAGKQIAAFVHNFVQISPG